MCCLPPIAREEIGAWPAPDPQKAPDGVWQRSLLTLDPTGPQFNRGRSSKVEPFDVTPTAKETWVLSDWRARHIEWKLKCHGLEVDQEQRDHYKRGETI